ncbi:hypothetical protein BpHYR1_008359 [Brachionus plicatilis]|uniref:Uncharacterized protein n=1 Tax=Brachionus plicatilis TaxID=10195 RepID=A0A3M7S988_BRAPC|nr:hypothetical protein BpHYR1_008359 [Brachionus plicatilis]
MCEQNGKSSVAFSVVKNFSNVRFYITCSHETKLILIKHNSKTGYLFFKCLTSQRISINQGLLPTEKKNLTPNFL